MTLEHWLFLIGFYIGASLMWGMFTHYIMVKSGDFTQMPPREKIRAALSLGPTWPWSVPLFIFGVFKAWLKSQKDSE